MKIINPLFKNLSANLLIPHAPIFLGSLDLEILYSVVGPSRKRFL